MKRKGDKWFCYPRRWVYAILRPSNGKYWLTCWISGMIGAINEARPPWAIILTSVCSFVPESLCAVALGDPAPDRHDRK